MKQLDEIFLESDGCHEVMMDYVASIGFEINTIEANNPGIDMEFLISNLVSLIKYCDSVLKDSELTRKKLDESFKETSILETKLDLEKKQREMDLRRSFHSHEVVKDEKCLLLHRIKNTEEKLCITTNKFNLLLQENSKLLQKVKVNRDTLKK